MSNTLVDEYRKKVPNDPRSDDQLTAIFGQQNDVDHRYDDYSDFVSDYSRLKTPQQQPEQDQVPLSAELRRGVSRGVSSLKSSAYGAGALAADVVGADSIKEALINRYKDTEQESAANAPGVGKIEDIKGPGDAARYVLGKAGELVPATVEAVGFGAAGALAGSALGPEGTVAGGLEGFLGRQAAKKTLKVMVEKGAKSLGLDEATAAVVQSQLKDIAERKIVQSLAPNTATLLKSELKAQASKLGMDAANFVNFGALGAGGMYPALAEKPGVKDEDARTAAAIAGVGSALSALLPSAALHKMFGGVGEEPAKNYISRLAVDAAKEIPAATAGMGLMEVANIAAERYADPEKRGGPLTDDELSRILNASVVGGMMGGVMAPLTAIKGPKTPKADPAVEQHFREVTPERRVQIEQAKGRIEAGQGTPEDISLKRTLNGQEEAFWAFAEPAKPEPETKAPVPETKPAPAETTPATTISKEAKTDTTANSTAGTTPKEEPAPAPVDSQATLAQKRAAAALTTSKADPLADAARAAVKKAELATDQNPSLAQKAAENYRKGELAGADIGIPGITIKVENPKDSTRTATSGAWSVEMPTTYGQILRTKGKDGDPLDIHIGPNPAKNEVYIIDQKNLATGAHDELKIMAGFESRAQAEAAYDAGFSDGKGPQRRDHVTTMTKDQFREWIKGDTTKPLKPEEVKPQGAAGAKADIGSEQSSKSGRSQQDRQSEPLVKEPRLATTEDKTNAERKPSTKPSDAHGGKPEGKNENGPPPSNEGGNGLRESGPREVAKEPAGESGKVGGEVAQGKAEEKPSGSALSDEALEALLKLAEGPKVDEETGQIVKTKPAAPVKEKPKTKLQEKIEESAVKAKEEMADLLKEWDSLDLPTGADMKLTLDPRDFFGLNPKVLELMTKVALKAIEIGAYKFAAFADHMVSVMGEKVAPFVARIYESVRSDLEKTDPAKAKLLTSKVWEAKSELSPVTKEVLDFHKKLHGREGVEVYEPGRAITVDDVDVGNRGVRDKSARGKGDWSWTEKQYDAERQRYMASKAYKSARGKMEPMPPWKDVDAYAKESWRETFLNRLSKVERDAVRAKEVDTVQPAYFVPRSNKLELLSKELLSDATPPGTQFRKSLTYRLADILDKATGQVHRVSVSKNNLEARVTKAEVFSSLGRKHETDRTVSLESVLGVKLRDGSGRFKVIGSLRTKGLSEYYESTFPDVKTYRSKFSSDVTERQKAVAATAVAEQTKMEKAGVEQGAKAKAEATEKPDDIESELGVHDTEEVARDKVGQMSELHPSEDTTEAAVSDSVSMEGYPDPKPINLEPNEVQTLIKEMPGHMPGDPVEGLIEMMRSPDMISDDLYAVIEKIAEKDITFFRRWYTEGGKETIAEYDKIEPRKTGPVEPSAVKPKGNDVQDSGQRVPERIGGPEAPVQGGENRPGPEQPAAEQGGGKGNSVTPPAGEGVKNRLPEPAAEPHSPEAEQLLNSIHAAARRAGIDILTGRTSSGASYEREYQRLLEEYNSRRFGDDPSLEDFSSPEVFNGSGISVGFADSWKAMAAEKISELGIDRPKKALSSESAWEQARSSIYDKSPPLAKFIDHLFGVHERRDTAFGDFGKPFGAYSEKTRTVYQVLGNTVGTSDVKTALHEVGHDAFAGESPENKARILRAVDRLSDEALGVDLSADPRIRSSDPANLGKAGVHEERLVESMAMKLADEGFDSDKANGFAKKFVRTLKNFYLRAAMKVQEMLGFEPNPDLALRYFENKVKSLLAGDTKGESYLQFTGAGRPSVAERRWDFHQVAERIGADGLEYDHAPLLSLGALKFNLDSSNLKSKASRTVEVEQLAATLNHSLGLLKKAGDALRESPDLVKSVLKGDKDSPEAFIRRMLRVVNPADAKKLLEAEKEVGGAAVKFDPNKTVEEGPSGFHDKANIDAVTRQAYATTEGMLTKTGNAITRRNDALAELGRKLSTRQDQAARAKTALDEINEIKKDTSKEVPNIDKMVMRRQVALERANRYVAATKRRIERTKTELEALEKIIPALSIEKDRLGSKLQVGVSTIWAHDMPYNVVPNPDATSAQILARDKSGAINTVKRLKLDSTGKVSNPADLEADILKNTAFLRKREAMAKAGDEGALDEVYQGIRRQTDEIIANHHFNVRVGAAERLINGLGLTPTGRRIADAFGTPVARQIDRMINWYTNGMESMHPHIERLGRLSLQAEKELLRLAPSLTHESLRDDYIYPAMHIMEHASDLAEIHVGQQSRLDRAIFQRVRDHLLKTQGSTVGTVIDRFMPLLEQAIKRKHEANQYLERQVREGASFEKHLGIDVRDPKLKAINPATGEREVATRAPRKQGPYTFTQRFSSRAREMAKALRASDWESFADAIKRLDNPDATKEDLEATRASLLRFTSHPEYSDAVRNDFVQALTDMENSPFQAPSSGDELVKTPADPELINDAFRKSKFDETGDLVGLAEAIHELHGGDEKTRTPYVREVLGTINDIYSELHGALLRHEGSATENPADAIRGMSPSLMIDARTIDQLPGSWFDYHSYDQRDMFLQSQRIASELAYGRGQERMAKAFETLGKEASDAQLRMNSGIRDVKRANPKATPKEIETALKIRFTPEAYSTLKAQASRADLIGKSIRELSDFYRKDNSPDGTLRATSRIAHSLGMLLVQQPASAIRNLEQLFAGHLRYGLSKESVGATAHTLKQVTSDAIGSLANAIGWHLQLGGDDNRIYNDLGLGDPTAVKKWHDAFDRLEGEGKTTQFFRGMDDLMGLGLGPKDTKHTVLRPLQPFTTSAIMVDKALTAGAWKLARSFVSKGIEFYEANRDKLEDPGFKVTPDAMKLKGASRDTFVRFNRDIERYGIDFDAMVKGAMQRGDKTMFSNEEAMRLYSMGVSELSSESNISTMPLGAYNNSILRVMSPLLGWPFRRMMDVLSLGRTPEGKHELQAFARGIAGLTVLAGGGLGISSLVALYQEEILGKKSNLRPLISDASPKEFALGIFENLNRAGTLGLLGEGINGMVNVGTGADNRILSLDQRVVAMGALSSITQAISAFINQGQADYAHVIRPLMSSAGGAGLIQYMQIANNAFGLDNPEARVTARINAQNWLRVGGRELGMDVRTTQTGSPSNIPTPLSPALTHMELAAYANNASDFRAAYNEAIQTAKEQGNEDPVDYVKRAYAARNPLRQIFKTTPSESEYRRLVNSLPSSGQQDVQEAVHLYNRFAESIGAKPFEGKQDKAETSNSKMGVPKFSSSPITAKSMSARAIFAR